MDQTWLYIPVRAPEYSQSQFAQALVRGMTFARGSNTNVSLAASAGENEQRRTATRGPRRRMEGEGVEGEGERKK